MVKHLLSSFFITLAVIALIGLGYFGLFISSSSADDSPQSLVLLHEPVEVIDVSKVTTKEEEIKIESEIEQILTPQAPEIEEASLVGQANLAIPFTSQAPTANWALPYDEACEETSILMVHYYYSGQPLPSPLGVERLIDEMVDWQIQEWGGHHDIPVVEMAELVHEFYDYETAIVELTPDRIRSLLDQGLPVIVPANGRALANPNFRNGGPKYHVLVVKGYKDNYFITNDPGTRNGADFTYTESNLMASIADWDKNRSSATGPKLGLVIYNN